MTPQPDKNSPPSNTAPPSARSKEPELAPEGRVRIKLVVAYVGTRYSGWQIQEKPNPPPTIQGRLEEAVQKICGTKIRVHGAGRTDSGVHADAQTAHMDIPAGKARLDWRKALNALLPDDIAVSEAQIAPPGFHARFSALRKAYSYNLWLDRGFVPPRAAPFVFACGPLDLEKIDAALPLLLGTKDFSSLRNAGTDTTSGIRTIYKLERETPRGNLLRLNVEADGFLKQMVRNITGLLVETGLGRLDPAKIPSILEAQDRKLSPSTAPARGLTLTKVYY